MDIKKMQAAAIALRDKNCEENYIEHINQSCPVNVLELIAQREMYARQAEEYRQKYQREHIETNRWKNRAELAEAQIEVAENYVSDKSADEVIAILSFDSAPAQSRSVKPGVAISLKGISEQDYNQFGALCILAGAEIGEFNRSQLVGYAYFGWSKNHGLYHSTSMIEFDDLISVDDLKSLQQSPEVTVPDEETNFCALKSITDSQVNAVARAFWRRIYAYRNDYGIELPKPLPVEFMAHMATALTWVDKDVPIPKQEPASKQDLSDAIMGFAGDFIGAFESGFINTPVTNIAQIYQVARNHVKDSYGIHTKPLVDEIGKESYDRCNAPMPAQAAAIPENFVEAFDHIIELLEYVTDQPMNIPEPTNDTIMRSVKKIVTKLRSLSASPKPEVKFVDLRQIVNDGSK